MVNCKVNTTIHFWSKLQLLIIKCHKMIYFKYIPFNISTNKYKNHIATWIFYTRNNTELWIFHKNSYNWKRYTKFNYDIMYCLLDHLHRSKYPLMSDSHIICLEILTAGPGHTSLTTSQSIPGMFYNWNLDYQLVIYTLINVYSMSK